MKKLLLVICVLGLFGANMNTSHASAFITITKDGKIRQNVLGESASNDSRAKEVALTKAKNIAEATLSIFKDGEKTLLSINSKDESTEEDMTRFTDDIIEIEQQESPKSIRIGKVNDSFGISQSGIIALTNYPIHVDAKSKALTVATSSGDRIISIMPDDAVETLVRANIINTVSPDGQMVLGEGENGELTYSIPAQKRINIFNVHTVLVPVDTIVSATNGKVLKIDQPKWLTIFGFLFS